MIKKIHMVIALVVVSVLFGSLLYNSLVLAGKPEPQPQTCKDAVEIDVFGWVTRQYTTQQSYPKEVGIYVQGNFPADLTFIFSPKGSLQNITEIVVVIYATDGVDAFSISVNEVSTYLGVISFPIDFPSTKLIQLDSTMIPIYEGINRLQLSASGSGSLSVYKVSIFVEYEYQA